MTELTLEQKRALAIARARVRAKQKVEEVAGSEPLPSMTENAVGAIPSIVSDVMRGMPLTGAIGRQVLSGMGKLTDRAAYNAGGGVTDALAPHVPAEVAGGAGYAANVATQAVPVLLGALTSKATLGKGMKWTGKQTMQSALKPQLRDIVSGKADRAVNTLLKEGANVTEGGAAKLQGIATKLDQQVDDIVRASPATITRARPQDEILDLLVKNSKTANPTAGENAIMSAWDDFAKSHPASMSVKEAQEIKQATYKSIERAYLTESSSARDSALKAIARGLRKAIEDAAPEVAPLNARSSDVLNALKQVKRRAGIAGNRDLLGLTPAGMNPQAMAAMLADRNPWFKSYMARALYSGSGPFSTLLGGGAGAQASILSGRSE